MEGRLAMLVCFFLNVGIYNYLEQAKALGTVLNRGAQADALGATQVFDRGGQTVATARGSCLS
jgi:hypothetical protein